MQSSEFEFREGYDPAWTQALMDLHNKTEMKRRNSGQVEQAFTASFAVITAWSAQRLLACGRMISDCKMYSAIFDVVVDPEFQKRGLGRELITRLIAKAPDTCIHLTSTFGNEDFYAKLGFKRHKTAMALYPPSMASSPYLVQNGEKIAQPTLETVRLRLEPYRNSDLDDVFAYASNPEVTRLLTWEAHQSLEDSKSFLNWVRASTRHERGSLFFVFAIRLKASGRVIGSIDFKNAGAWAAQIDYALGREHWGKGLMTEAAAALRDWAFAEFPEIIRFQAFCEPENLGSARVMQKIGMEFEGLRKRSFKVRDRVVDTAHYALVRP